MRALFLALSSASSATLIGAYSVNGSKMIRTCNGIVISYHIDSVDNNYLNYASNKSGESYSVKRLIVKWVLYIAGYLLVSIAAPLLSTFIIRDAMCWKEPIVGPITATLIVLYSFAAAPEHKKQAAVGGYLFGLFLAYQIPDMHWYPECHSKAYQSTPLPLVLTYISGLVALLTVWFYSTKKHDRLLQPTTKT